MANKILHGGINSQIDAGTYVPSYTQIDWNEMSQQTFKDVRILGIKGQQSAMNAAHGLSAWRNW